MAITELLNLSCSGAALALAVRWLLSLEVTAGWAACIGVLGASVHRSLSLPFDWTATVYGLPQLLMTAVVILALLAMAQVIRGS